MPAYVPPFTGEFGGFASYSPYGDVGSSHLTYDAQGFQETKLDLGPPTIAPTLVVRQRVRVLVASTETLPARSALPEPDYGVADIS